MNYRHAFHAGNFADVVKHVIFARIVAHLRRKPGAFRIIDTHAGAGLYALSGPQASRTGEWRDGIGRLMAATADPPVRDLLAGYCNAVASFNPDRALSTYPGSPALGRTWLRTQDRLVACEREPGAAAALAANMRGDARVKVLTIDGYAGLNAQLPPKERRGVVLVDPPFEQPGELDRLCDALARAHRKWSTGIYQLWYPIKDGREIEMFARRIARLGIPRILRTELMITDEPDPRRLNGSGLLIVNPPWMLHRELELLLPPLATLLGREGRGTVGLQWLTREK